MNETLKKFLMHLLTGFSVTLMVTMPVQLIVSGAVGSAVAPRFAALFRNEQQALIVQLMLIGLIGAAFSCAAMIFDLSRWSYLKQGVVHFLATAAVWVPVTLLCWRPETTGQLMAGLGGWTFTYVVNWTVQYAISRRRVRALNETIRAFHETEEREHDGKRK